jgi:1-acyl-sn-glycerol-3-phosphate acyltransferase
LGPFKGGSLYPAVQAGLPIVPISIAGSRHVMRKGRLMTCPGEVELLVHEPIPTVASAEPDVRAVRALAGRVHDIIAPTVEAEACNS